MSAELREYKKWCEKHGLRACEYVNLFLFENKNDMGFFFDFVSDYGDTLTSAQMEALRD